ncbi:MAG: PA0069 family radical SAM protein [Pseudomonadota bacterium]
MSERLFPDLDPNTVTHGDRRGRGAGLNMASRYDRQFSHATYDGWHREEAAPTRTRVQVDKSRTILAQNRSPDVPFDRSINPYRGCEHGCIYCFARPTHAHLGLSPGLDFETRLFAKPDAATLLAGTLARPGYRPETIAIGTNTDPYQPVEKRWQIMRQILDVLWEHRHPVSITTKGSLVIRDADILGRMGRAGLATVAISLTTLDNSLSRAMEPRAAAPGRRIAAIRMLAQAGVPVTVNLSPVVPGLTDHEIERLVQAAAEAGARYASSIALRLPQEVAPLFREWLAREAPDRAAKVMARVREMHGGQDYDSRWFHRMRGEGVYADILRRRFELARKRHGLGDRGPALRTDLFQVPPRAGDQLTLGL